MPHLQEKRIQKDVFTLRYYTQGSSFSEAIIFLHAAYGDLACFHHQFEAFAGDYHVINAGHTWSASRSAR